MIGSSFRLALAALATTLAIGIAAPARRRRSTRCR